MDEIAPKFSSAMYWQKRNTENRTSGSGSWKSTALWNLGLEMGNDKDQMSFAYFRLFEKTP